MQLVELSVATNSRELVDRLTHPPGGLPLVDLGVDIVAELLRRGSTLGGASLSTTRLGTSPCAAALLPVTGLDLSIALLSTRVSHAEAILRMASDGLGNRAVDPTRQAADIGGPTEAGRPSQETPR